MSQKAAVAVRTTKVKKTNGYRSSMAKSQPAASEETMKATVPADP